MKISLPKILKEEPYKVLQTDPHLGDHIMLLTFGGSIAYGTSQEGSDVDVRGITANGKRELLGMSKFDQYRNPEIDTTIYGLKKFFQLAINCNPNAIEILGCPQEDYAHVSETGALLLKNKNLFLSRRAINTFGIYAKTQLDRLRLELPDVQAAPDEKGKYILESCQASMNLFEEEYGIPHGLFILCLANSRDKEGVPELSVRINPGEAGNYDAVIPVDKAKAYLNEFAAIKKSYDSLGKRNEYAFNQSKERLNKHAMHLIRLFLTGLDILEKGEVNTYRQQDIPLLMDIRNGKYMNKSGHFLPEFFALVDDYQKRLEYASEHTALPALPAMQDIEDLLVELNERNLANIH